MTEDKKWHCEACNVTCNDKKSYDAHVKTIEHEVSVKYNDVVTERQTKETQKKEVSTKYIPA